MWRVHGARLHVRPGDDNGQALCGECMSGTAMRDGREACDNGGGYRLAAYASSCAGMLCGVVVDEYRFILNVVAITFTTRL